MFYRTISLSSFTAPLAAAAASFFAIATIFAVQPFRLWPSCWHGFTREIVTAHWRYGRWGVLSGIVSWAVSWSPGGLYYLLIVPLLAGLQDTAALSALWNLVMPEIQLNLALTLLLVPAFGRMRRDLRAASLMWIALFALLAAASLYAVIIGLFGGPLIDVVYRGRYAQYAHFAWLVGLAALPTAAITVFESALRACERPDRVLSAYIVSAAVTCSFGVAAVAAWGLLGAIMGLLASCVTVLLVELWWVLRTDTWQEKRAAAGPSP
jgi:O-antigen/teichoic acid export membrane protein